MEFQYDVVGKIGSMALIRKEDHDIDYNIFSKIGAQLRPGIVWVSSGATEIGRLDYQKRNGGSELLGDIDDVKTDYAAQGQAILMENYRRFISPEYSVRQVLVEHQHFNDEKKREHIRSLLLRARDQRAIPIVNYNDPVSSAENRKMEIAAYQNKKGHVVECIDNDEPAAVIAQLVGARTLVILTSVEGIYSDPKDPKTLVREVTAHSPEELRLKLEQLKACCVGASRAGANGAEAKITYVTDPALAGTTVIIGHARHGIEDLMACRVPCTRIGLI